MVIQSVDANSFYKISVKICFLLLGLFVLIFMPFRIEASNGHSSQIVLSEEEQQWIKNNHKLKLGVGTAFPPFMWIDQKEGNPSFKGIVSDYVNLLSDRLNIDMEIEFGISFKEALSKGKDGQLDLFPCLSNTPERRQFLLFTEPYLRYPMVIITREDAPLVGGIEDLEGKKIAIVKHLVVYSKLQNDYPGFNLDYLFTEKVDENLEAVSFGRADACIINLAAASYYIHLKGLTNLRIAAPIGWNGVHLSMGIRQDLPILKGIIEKGLRSISQSEKDEISQRWIRVEYKPGVDMGLIFRWVLGLGGTFSIIFFIILAWNRRLQKEITGRKKAEKKLERLIVKLQNALCEVKTLQGFIPICSSCKKIRDDKGFWNQIEHYIQMHSEAEFSHGICPECSDNLYGEEEWYKDRQSDNMDTD